MRSLRYLNTILTLIAVLLTLHLVMLWGGAPLEMAGVAQAQGLPDAGAQRSEQTTQLKQLNQKVEELTGLFKSGQARVRLEAAGADKAPGR